MAAYDSNFAWTGNGVSWWSNTAQDTTTVPFFHSTNHPVDRALRSRRAKWLDRAESFEERKRREARERTLAAILLRKLLSPEALPERQYDRDRREGRAVGVDSRYRVMLC
jgi:hypothetical protein